MNESQTNTQNVCPACGGPGYHISGCSIAKNQGYVKQITLALEDAVKERDEMRGQLDSALRALDQETKRCGQLRDEGNSAIDVLIRIKLVLGIDLATRDADVIVAICRGVVARLFTAEAEREKDRKEWMDQMDEIQRKDHQLEKAINALKLAYARGHFCDDVPCPGCECGYALDAILGREVSQEECEQFVEEQFKVKSNSVLNELSSLKPEV